MASVNHNSINLGLSLSSAPSASNSAAFSFRKLAAGHNCHHEFTGKANSRGSLE